MVRYREFVNCLQGVDNVILCGEFIFDSGSFGRHGLKFMLYLKNAKHVM